MSNDQTRAHLLGTWKLLSAVREDIPSGAKTDLLGANPVGYINYAPDGRMMVINVGGERPKPAAGSATSAGGGAVPQHDQLRRHLHDRRRRDHPSRRRVVERKLDRHPAEALRSLRGQSRLSLEPAVTRSGHRGDERAHHDVGEGGTGAPA